jgi:electron transfer flavoprotein beta subunit
MEKIIVCLKPVPDPKAWDRLAMDTVTKTLIREGIPSVINPLDKQALEAALEIKDACGAEVVLLAMAPAATQPVLREALAGADRAVLLSDRWFAGSDTLATSRILAAAIGRLAPFDLVCCGNFTLDGSTAQVPSQVAEILGIPNIMHVSAMEFTPAQPLLVTQKIEQDWSNLRPSLPCCSLSPRKPTSRAIVPFSKSWRRSPGKSRCGPMPTCSWAPGLSAWGAPPPKWPTCWYAARCARA